MLKIKKFLVFTLFLCYILVVKRKDSGVKIHTWALVYSTYVRYSCLICEMGCNLPPEAIIETENEEICGKEIC